MRARKGMSLVELIVALTVLSGVLLAMSGLFVIVTRRAQANDADLRRAAFMQSSISFLEAIPFDSLPAKARTDSVRIGANWVIRQIGVVDSSASRRQVTVRIMPRASRRPETVTFTRTKPTCTSVLNTAAGAC